MFSDEYMLYLNENTSVGFSVEQLQAIKDSMDIFLNEYDVHKKCTEIALVDEFPYEYGLFFMAKSVEGMSEKSQKTYKSHLNCFFNSVRKRLNEITTNDIRAYLYRRSKEVSKSTVEDSRVIIGSFFSWCVDNEYLERNPMRGIKPIKKNKKCREALTEDDLEQLRKGCKTLRDQVILEVLYSTGCRVTELSNMAITDVDFQQRTVKIVRKGGKEDFVYLNPKAYNLVCEYLQSRKDMIDALIYSSRTKTNLSSDGIRLVLEKIKKRANFTKKTTPHVIRHTTATIALKRGMPIEEVSKMLGHSSIETTMIYAEVNRDKLKADHEKYVV